MSRLRPYLLLTCFAFTGFCGSGPVFAKPLCHPSALALVSGDQDRDTDKYNRKLEKLEIKRARDRQKLEADYMKLFKRKKSMDLLKLQERLEEFKLKQEKLEEKYRRDLEKLERDRARRG